MNIEILCGRLVDRPQLKTARNGSTYCTFIVAVKRKRGKATNRRKDGDPSNVDYIDCIAWNNIAQNLRRYAPKGGMILVVGEHQTFVRRQESGYYLKKHYLYVVEADLINWRRPEEEVSIDYQEATAQPSAFELDIADSIVGYSGKLKPRPRPNLEISDSKLAGFDGDPDMPDLYGVDDYDIDLDDDDLDDMNDMDKE